MDTNWYTGQSDPSQPSDPNKRSWLQIMNLSDHELEFHHDFIQWLFPLPESSTHVRDSPLLDPGLVAAFRAPTAEGWVLRDRLARAFLRLCQFWGFDVSGDGDRPPWHRVPPLAADVDPLRLMHVSGESLVAHPELQKRWVLWPRDHNHLRMSRVIRCLRVLGLGGHAKGLFLALVDLRKRLGNGGGPLVKSEEYWRRAMERGLEWKPDDEKKPTAAEWLKGMSDQVDVYAGRDASPNAEQGSEGVEGRQ